MPLSRTNLAQASLALLEATSQVAGNVSGQVSAGQINTSVTSPVFLARLLVTTKGGHQSVSIQPRGTDVRSVNIELRRS